MFPAAVVPSPTVSGDSVTGPGIPNVTICSMPASVVGDTVSGAVCSGAVSMGSSTVYISGRPAARVTSQVSGVNVTSGAPMTTAIAPPGIATVSIGG